MGIVVADVMGVGTGVLVDAGEIVVVVVVVVVDVGVRLCTCVRCGFINSLIGS